jgi:uncharacterized protein YukE
MQRIESTINEMGQTMENIYTVLKNLDDKLDRLAVNNTNTNQRSARSIASNIAVKFSSVDEEIP